MNWIQRVPLSQRLLLLVPYKPSYAAALRALRYTSEVYINAHTLRIMHPD